MTNLKCFKAYDIRGRLGSELNEEIAYKIGRAYAEFIKPKVIVVGGDIRLTSESLKKALADGIRDYGADVIDIGMVGTEQVYFATSLLKADGGIEVTASHNPIDFNGMKLVRENSKPISKDNGLWEIKSLAEKKEFSNNKIVNRGKFHTLDILPEYCNYLLNWIAVTSLKPLKIVMNAGNGSAGPVVDALHEKFRNLDLPIEIIKINNDPDGTFPNGIPNPILKENRSSTINAVISNGADLGVAWDGDFDRCFLVDERGIFVEGYYIVGLLAKAFLTKNKKEKIVHDPRLVWNTIDIVSEAGGTAIQSKTGHAFIKDTMRRENAVYGGEMSAHHYFRDFNFCDSGMIPWLLIIELMSEKKCRLSTLVQEMMDKYPSPGEINYKALDPERSLQTVYEHFKSSAISIDTTDGISLEFQNWRFNLRVSNTEPLVRLNLESKMDKELLKKYENQIASMII